MLERANQRRQTDGHDGDALNGVSEGQAIPPRSPGSESAPRRIEDLQPGDHTCFLYGTDDEHRDVLGPFLCQGLQIETELQAEREKAQQYLDLAAVVFVALDVEGQVTLLNRRGEQLLGYREEELLGRNWFETCLSEGLRESVWSVFKQLMAGAVAPVEYYENRVLTRSGEERIIAWHNAVMRDATGRIVGTLGSGEDITDRRQAEEAAWRAQQQLIEQQRLETERVEAELQRVRDQLVRTTRLAAIGQVSASIAHDLRNPLGAVRNAAYYLKRRVPDDQLEFREYLEIIDQEIGAADNIIRNLLGMARAREPRKQEFDFCDLVKDLFRHATTENVVLRLVADSDPFLVYADSGQFRQVVQNLLINAVQAMDGEGEFVVEAWHELEYDSIVFRDTGTGVADDVQDSLFEPLVTTKAKGTGLGLTICRSIIERHGGTIELAENEGAGTSLRIRLIRDGNVRQEHDNPENGIRNDPKDSRLATT